MRPTPGLRCVVPRQRDAWPHYTRRTQLMANHFRLKICLSGIIAALSVLHLVSHIHAAEPIQSPRSHSLIHRQPSEVKSSEAVTPPILPGTAVTPSPRPLPRKLTKRPAQLSTPKPLSDAATSQVAAPVSESGSGGQAGKRGSERHVSTVPTGGAGHGTASPSPAPLSSAVASTTTSSVGAVSTGRAPMAGAVAGAGAAPSAFLGSAASGGRGLQRLTTQMPNLTHLVAPTVSVSSPPPSPAPSSGTTQSPSSSSSSPPATAPSAPSSGALPGAGSATLSWTLNSETDLAGYKIYIGTSPGSYTYPGSPMVIGRIDSYAITGLPIGQTYYFAISAFDDSGNESGLSAEVSKSLY